MERAFASDDGPFDFVYNLAAETKYGQSEEVNCTHYGTMHHVVIVMPLMDVCLTGLQRACVDCGSELWQASGKLWSEEIHSCFYSSSLQQ